MYSSDLYTDINDYVPNFSFKIFILKMFVMVFQLCSPLVTLELLIESSTTLMVSLITAIKLSGNPYSLFINN